MKKVIDRIFPPRCCSCDDIPEKDSPTCLKCKELILHPANELSRCGICFMSNEKCICSKRQYYDKLCASFIYEGSVTKTIFKLKFRSRPDIAKGFAKQMLLSLRERDMLSDIDIITFIPMSSFAKFKRGYNQSQLLAKYLSQYSGIPYDGLLMKLHKTKAQHTLNNISRSGNLLGLFEPIKDKTELIRGKTVLVVDDVSTTGATFNEIAKTLLIFGAACVYAASCTTTQKKSQKKY